MDYQHQNQHQEMNVNPNTNNNHNQQNIYMQNEAPAQPNYSVPDYSERIAPKEDIENGVSSPLDVNSMIRMGFIRKVYGILSFQMLLTVSFMCLSFIPSFNSFLKHNLALFWVSLGLSLLIVFPLLCFRKLARGVPQNYILLFLWTLCESYMLATCCAFYDPKVVMLAGVMTLAVTISLTIYAWTTKTDFTFLGGLLFCAVTILFFYSIFSFIFGFMFNAVYCILGLIIYSIYLIYDTQLIIGKFGNEYQIDDYIYAALTIYIDIIQIFLYLLQLFGGRR